MVTRKDKTVITSLYTIGHSTHPLDFFINLLRNFRIEMLADVRTIPRSRKNPQFNKYTFPFALQQTGIDYRHLKGLGGLRKTLPNSLNKSLQNKGLRGYADYMQTDDFRKNLAELIALAQKQRTAIMCAEAVP